MRGLILLLATAVTCSRAGYVGSYGSPLVHHPQAHQQVAPSYAPPAPVGEDGNVVDTPEVAQAKAAHFAEFARAAARAAVDEKQHQPQHHQLAGYNPQYSSPAYNYQTIQPTAAPYLRQTSYQQPTTIYQTASRAPAASVYGTAGGYQQPQAYDARANFVGQKSYALAPKTAAFVPAPLAEDGTVVDTPEVAALKAARLSELAEAEARAYKHASSPQPYDPDQDQGQVYSGSPVAPAPVNYEPGYNLGHYGASRAFPGPSYHGTQPYSAQQTAFVKPYNPSSVYQPQHYQPQQLIGTY